MILRANAAPVSELCSASACAIVSRSSSTCASERMDRLPLFPTVRPASKALRALHQERENNVPHHVFSHQHKLLSSRNFSLETSRNRTPKSNEKRKHELKNKDVFGSEPGSNKKMGYRERAPRVIPARSCATLQESPHSRTSFTAKSWADCLSSGVWLAVRVRIFTAQTHKLRARAAENWSPRSGL